MAGAPDRRRLPVNPYSSQPVAAWQEQLKSGRSLEDRYRAFVALTELQETAETLHLLPEVLQDAAGDLRAAAANWVAVGLSRQRITVEAATTGTLVPALIPLLQDADPDVQLAAVRALSHLQPELPELVVVITTLLNRDDIQPTSQVILAEVCGRLPSLWEACLPRLRQFLSADQGDVREAAAIAISRMGTQARPALPELTTALDDEEPVVRESAAIALGQLAPLPPEAKTALQSATEDEDEGVAEAAKRSWTAAGL